MKNSGFPPKTYEHKLKLQQAAQKRAVEKKVSKPRKSALPKKKTAKRKQKRTKLPTTKKMRNKCDKLLTPILKAKYQYCFLQGSKNCYNYSQVAHHHILKSQCSALRYEIENLIPLCHSCHCMLHNHESYWSSVIVEKKGLNWFRELEEKKNMYVKTDVHFYIANLERLENILDDLMQNP